MVRNPCAWLINSCWLRIRSFQPKQLHFHLLQNTYFAYFHHLRSGIFITLFIEKLLISWQRNDMRLIRFKWTLLCWSFLIFEAALVWNNFIVVSCAAVIPAYTLLLLLLLLSSSSSSLYLQLTEKKEKCYSRISDEIATTYTTVLIEVN